MNLSQRLKRLEELVGSRSLKGVLRLEGGGTFRAECDPMSYLLQNGVETPQGRIVGIDPPAGELDPVSASLYEEIGRIIREGSK